MVYGSKTRFSHHATKGFVGASFVCFIADLPMASFAQGIDQPAPTGPESTSSNGPATASIGSTESQRSMTTSFTTPISNSSTPTPTSTFADLPPDLFGDTPPSSAHQPNESVFNYYFLFLVLFGLVVAVALWYLHRHRKKRKEQMRLSGQTALARDMDGWINTRRWFHGAWRPNQTVAFVRREEGLNERGEPPPPYEPKSEATVSQQPNGTQQSLNGLTIPLRTLSIEEVGQGRPPRYHDNTSLGQTSTDERHMADASANAGNTGRSSSRSHRSTEEIFQSPRVLHGSDQSTS
jgi:hypothetical protein